MKRLRSQSGMSLIVVMIGLSIVSTVLLVVFRLLDMSREMAGSFQNAIKAVDAMQEVRFAFADAATCTFNLQGVVPGPPSAPTQVDKQLSFPTAGVFSQQIITFGGLGETSIRVSKITLSLPDTPTPNAAVLRIEMETKGFNKRPMRPRATPVWIKQDGTGRVTCCSTRSLALCP